MAEKLPTLKSVVGPKALLKDLCFALKTFSYMPNLCKGNSSYDPYLKSKEVLNGDHTEAVDILSSQDITLEQLTDIFMASKLLGFEGHEKLIDILSTIKVGVPDPLNFAMDLTAFFEENCKKDIYTMKNKAQNDPKAILKTAENLIVKSGLWASGKPNGNKPSGHPYFDTTSPPPALLENGFYTHQDHEDMKFDTLEKAIARLNHDVTELKSIDELTRQQTKVELGHVRRDQDAKFLEIRQSVKQISVEMDALKKEVQEMRGLNLAPGFGAVGASNTAVAKPTGNVYVKVALQHNRHEVHEFPTDESGNLSFTAVNAVYPGKLKFIYHEFTKLCT